MTQSNDQPNDRDILTRIATIEYQIVEIQNVQAQLRTTVAPGGYVTDAIERVFNQLGSQIEVAKSEVKSDIVEVKSDIRELNGKIDIIIRRLSGMSNLE